MKRLLMLLAAVGIMFGLVACGSNDEDTTDNDAPEENTEPTEENDVDEESSSDEDKDVDEEPSSEKEDEPEDTEKADEPEKSTPEDDNDEDDESEISEFKESSVIEDEIDVSDLDANIETDNNNKRVILFKDGDKAVYKTIFIKNKDRLKIIDIGNDKGQIYNETI